MKEGRLNTGMNRLRTRATGPYLSTRARAFTTFPSCRTTGQTPRLIASPNTLGAPVVYFVPGKPSEGRRTKHPIHRETIAHRPGTLQDKECIIGDRSAGNDRGKRDNEKDHDIDPYALLKDPVGNGYARKRQEDCAEKNHDMIMKITAQSRRTFS